MAQCGPRHPDSFPSPLCRPLLSPSSRGLKRSRARVATAVWVQKVASPLAVLEETFPHSSQQASPQAPLARGEVWRPP